VSVSPKILAIDCATTGCSAGLWCAGKMVANQTMEMQRGQAEVLVPMMQRVLRDANVEAKDLTAIAVTNGPGAFTGLRIGLAAARGLALALDINCIGVTTLVAVVQAVPAKERAGNVILAAIESKRADIFVQVFDGDLKPLCEPQATGTEALVQLCAPYDNVVAVGDAVDRAQDMLSGSTTKVIPSAAPNLPLPEHIAALAALRLGNENNQAPEPLYLRPPDAKLPKAQGRARA